MKTESRATAAERSVTLLQKEVDRLEGITNCTPSSNFSWEILGVILGVGDALVNDRQHFPTSKNTEKV